jgi:hypothetical protein
MSPERAIQRALLARMACCLPLGAVVLHVPNEDATGSAAYGQAKIRDGLMPGCPDLLIVYQGLAYWLEMKAPEGEVSDNQRAAHKRLRMAGSPVEVAYSVEDGLAALQAWGLISTTPPNTDTRSQSSGGQRGRGA